MEKVIVYRSTAEAYQDQFWMDVLGSATAYDIYVGIGYALLGAIIVLTLRWAYRSVMKRLKKPKHYRDIY